MSEKNELMRYVLETPGNTNPAVLSSKLDKFAAESGVTPTGTIQITENDTYDVTNYASAVVNVPSGISFCTVITEATTEVEFSEPYSASLYTELPFLQERVLTAAAILGGNEEGYSFALINGKQVIMCGYGGEDSPVVSGNATYDPENQTITVTGNCTLKAYGFK